MNPTASQEEYFAKCFGCARFVYNHALKEQTDAYSSKKKSLSFFDLCANIRELRRQPEYGWLNDVPAMTLNYSLLNLDNAYKRFFKTKGGFPHFKSKKHSRDAVKFDPPSKRYLRYRAKLARVHRHIENRRTDFLQKATTGILRRYDTVCLEDLNVKGMMRNHSLAGAIGSVAWSRFNSMLEYKAERYGKNILRIGRFDASSQTCSACGYRNAEVKDLSVREWTCPQCGAHHDRDVNAAMNIKALSLREYFNKQRPTVTGITDADGADSESDAGTGFPVRNYASVQTKLVFNLILRLP